MSDMTIHLLKALTDGMLWLDAKKCTRLGCGKEGRSGEEEFYFSGGQVGWGDGGIIYL
jgi:hypothetical protein